MSVSKLHRKMQYYSGYYLTKYTDLVGYEISGKQFGANSIYDVMGVDINKQNIWSVEVKKNRADFTRDEKLLVDSGTYLEQVNYTFLCCPKGVIEVDEVPAPLGLLYYYDNMLPVKYLKRDIENRKIIDRDYTHIPKSRYYELVNSSVFEQEAKNKFSKVVDDIEITYTIQNMFSVRGDKTLDEVCSPVIKVIKEATYFEESFCSNLNELLTLVKRIGNKTSEAYINNVIDKDEINCYNKDEELGR